ncbi:MAG TPA: alpha/beta hydrolase [Chloroflexia bacterium]|nr:alpha/beta hydrolase [Chloroflexia bacterium]
MNSAIELSAQGFLVCMPLGPDTLEGILTVPASAQGLVIFASSGESSQYSPKNRYLAKHFQKAGLATLLFDLLTPTEAEYDQLTEDFRYNITLLSQRLIAVTRWIKEYPAAQKLKAGYFGSGSASAAALLAAAELPEMVGAIVSKSGRPNLTGAALQRVKAPTLLLVGSADTGGFELNRQAFSKLETIKDLEIIPETVSNPEETFVLEKVAWLAGRWFQRYLIEEQEH